jgi:hypothetical protein
MVAGQNVFLNNAPGTSARSPVQVHTVASDETATQIAGAVDDYFRALATFRETEKRQSLEPVFAAGLKACQLMQTSATPGGASFLESQTDDVLAPLLNKMPGFDRGGEMGQGLMPVWEFFQRAANEKGTPADVAFFTLMLDTRPNGSFPAWVTQTTDDSGCTSYGSGALTALYGRWNAFQHDFPRSYRVETESALQTIVEEFTNGDCACGNRKSVVSEFDLFLHAYAADPVSESLRNRLTGIQDGSVPIRYNCLPG